MARPAGRARAALRAGVAAVLAGTLLGAPAHAEPAQGAAASSGPGLRPQERSAASSGNGPVGWEVYRQLDRLPELASGVDARQFSSFDRTGGNDDGFFGTYSCLDLVDGRCVIAEHTGPGELQSIWSTRGFFGDSGDVTETGTLRIELDGQVVLDAPFQDVVDGELGTPFIHPLVTTTDQSSGGVTIRVPMPYRESMRVSTEHNPSFYHVGYRAFADAAGVQTFDPEDRATDVLEALGAWGTTDPKPAPRHARTESGAADLQPGQTMRLAQLRGPGTIDEVDLALGQLVGPELGRQVTDDGRAFTGSSEFTMTIDPANEGVWLTRRFSTDVGRQHAEIAVDGTPAGQWLPREPDGHVGWAEQRVLLPAELTAGRSEITLRNTFLSSDGDVNEFSYWVDSVVAGEEVRTDELSLGVRSLADERAHDYRIAGETWNGVRTFRYPDPDQDEAPILRSDELLTQVRLQISFDGELTVDAPLGEFFGSGLGWYEVRSLMSRIDPEQRSMTSWWPMPYRQSAVVELVNDSTHVLEDVETSLSWHRAPENVRGLGPAGDLGYFHATSARDQTAAGEDWIYLDVAGRGKLVGVAHTMAGLETEGNFRDYLEGDERISVDNLRTPQIYGTGTEDFFEGGWYFLHGPFSLPFTGAPAHERQAFGCVTECDSAYRLMIGDAVPFSTALRFGIEHGPANDRAAQYGSTAYWYGQHSPGRAVTDRLDIGDPASEAAHGYHSTDSGTPVELISMFEGIDDERQVTDTGRATSAVVTFTVALDPDNDGAVLRRQSDQEQSYQAAAVHIDGVRVGTWEQPFGNEHQRWLEDSFLLPASVTAGLDQIEVRLEPLTGRPAWHAARYEALS